MRGSGRAPRRLHGRRGLTPRARFAIVAAFAACVLPAAAPRAEATKFTVVEDKWQWTENPFAGRPEAVEEGRRIYKSTCYICHFDTGGRGPNLHKTQLRGTDFLRVVKNGRKGTQMPAWKDKLTEGEMWKVLTYIEAGTGQP